MIKLKDEIAELRRILTDNRYNVTGIVLFKAIRLLDFTDAAIEALWNIECGDEDCHAPDCVAARAVLAKLDEEV